MKRHQIIALVVIALGIPFLFGSTIIQSAYSLIENNGSGLTRRTILNFPNSGCADNSGAQRTDCTFLTAGSLPANYTQSFVSQTTVVLTHNLNTLAVIVQCFDAASPPAFIIPNTIKITDANNVTVTFSAPQSGKCQVNGSNGSGGGGGSGGGNFGFTFTSPTLVTWTQQDFGSATSDTTNGISIVSKASEGAFNIHALTTPYPATPFHVEYAFLVLGNTGTNAMAGPCITDGTKYQIYTAEFQGDPARQVGFTATNSTTYGGSTLFDQTTQSMRPLGLQWVRYGDDGTNRSFDISADGIAWVPIPYSEGNTTFLTPTKVCFYVDASPAVVRLLSYKVTP